MEEAVWLIEVNEAKRMKELERENTELKKMLAEALLKNRMLEFVCEKSCEPGTSSSHGPEGRGGEDVLRASSVSIPEVAKIDVEVSSARADAGRAASGRAPQSPLGKTSSVRLSPDRGAAAESDLDLSDCKTFIGQHHVVPSGVALANFFLGLPVWAKTRVRSGSSETGATFPLPIQKVAEYCAKHPTRKLYAMPGVIRNSRVLDPDKFG